MFALIILFSIFAIVPLQCYLEMSPTTAQLIRDMIAQGHKVYLSENSYQANWQTYSSYQRSYYGSSYSYPYYNYYGNSYYPSYSYGNSYYPYYGNYGNSNYYYG